MPASYVPLTNASPFPQQGTLRHDATTQYILRGDTLDASMTETAQGKFDIGVALIIDPGVKCNAYPASFGLYINGVKACSISTVQDASTVSIPAQFAGHAAFAHAISLIQLIPVYSHGTEDQVEAFCLK